MRDRACQEMCVAVAMMIITLESVHAPDREAVCLQRLAG